MKVETLWDAQQVRIYSNYVTGLIFVFAARWTEIIDENEIPDNCDWNVTIYVITDKYLEWMLFLLNSNHDVVKKNLT